MFTLQSFSGFDGNNGFDVKITGVELSTHRKDTSTPFAFEELNSSSPLGASAQLSGVSGKLLTGPPYASPCPALFPSPTTVSAGNSLAVLPLQNHGDHMLCGMEDDSDATAETAVCLSDESEDEGNPVEEGDDEGDDEDDEKAEHQSSGLWAPPKEVVSTDYLF
ncbi:uncharacterized protein LOC109616030 isoform X2 [Esox lucius]|uniref:uncharacterized protein LOC109616030 isoform X2 n=1 Tax=Esox lucius TaxID=8010 RepID=UPI0014775B61|nr:uncharacterized protein LOC109616030 isoform X2 [Esox lucius]